MLTTLLGLSAYASEETALADAKRYFDEGQVLYLQGRFKEASEQFDRAYRAKPYAAFLFNEAVCYEKAGELQNAIDRYARFLVASPNAPERKEIEQRIDALRKQLASATPGTESAALPTVSTRGLVVVESKPEGAIVFLDDRSKGPAGTTPYSATLEGKHTIFVEMKGYASEKKEIQPNPSQLTYLYMSLAKEHYLGWVEIVTPGAPGADVYFDRREAGSAGKTPYMGNLRPGKHLVWIERRGYRQIEREIEVLPGGTHRIEVTLEPQKYGLLTVMGRTTRGASIIVDERELPCRSQYPCRIDLPPGRYDLQIERDDQKTYSEEVEIREAHETQLRVKLEPEPARTSAYVSLAVAAAMAGGGAAMVVWANNNEPAEGEDTATHTIIQYGGYGLLGIGALSAVFGVYYLVRDVGPPSIGEVETKSLLLSPTMYSGGGGAAVGWLLP